MGLDIRFYAEHFFLIGEKKFWIDFDVWRKYNNVFELPGGGGDGDGGGGGADVGGIVLYFEILNGNPLLDVFFHFCVRSHTQNQEFYKINQNVVFSQKRERVRGVTNRRGRRRKKIK